MEITVTLPLYRYKELEAYKKAIELMKEKKEFIIASDDIDYLTCLERDEAVARVLKMYDAITNRISRIRNRMVEYDNLKKKPADLKAFFNDVLYY